MIKKEFLSFQEITKEAQEHYNDLTKLITFDEKQKQQFFNERKKTLEKFIELILYTNFPNLSDTQVHYSLFGPFYELLVKLCLLKEDWKKYIEEYNTDKSRRNFEHAKGMLFPILKNKKLNDKQIRRVREILDFVQIQRNNFLHSPFKGYDHYATQTQFFELIAILDNLFGLKIDDTLLFDMLNQTFYYKRNQSGFDFEEVFEDMIKEVYKNLKPRNKELDELMEQRYDNWATTFFEHDNGEFYPKKISPPEIELIQYPEPHVLITDLYDDPKEWYSIYILIEHFAEQSFLSYRRGYYHASISCAINCCECILKYEFMRISPREYAEQLIENKAKGEPQFALGFFTGNNSKKLNKLKIKSKFEKKLNYLNNVRIALYHFNPKKINKLRKSGKTFLEKNANPITDELTVPIVAYRVYIIMQDMLKHFYNKKTRLKFIKEGLEDYEKRKNEAVEKAHASQIKELPQLPKDFIEGYMEKKNEFIKKEYLRTKK